MRWANDLINIIFPRRCHVCEGTLAPHERFACTGCLAKLPRTGYHRRSMNPMEERFAGLFPFVRGTGHFFYSRESALSTLIQDMKYRNFSEIGKMLGKITATELYSTGFFNDVDVIVPVPMHFWKHAKRGYNQVEKIAEGISIATGFPIENALKMTRRHSTQTSRSKEERIANTKNLFAVKKPENIVGKGILLVDDVCTSGATMTAAALAITKQCMDTKLTLLSIGVTF